MELMNYLLELGDDGEDEGEHAEERGGRAELRALSQSHGIDRSNSSYLSVDSTLITPASVGLPEN